MKSKPIKGLMDSQEMVERFYWFVKPIWEQKKVRITIFEHIIPPSLVAP